MRKKEVIIKYPEKMCSSCEFIKKVYDKNNSTEKKPVYYYICSKSNMIIGPAWIKCDDKYKEKKEEKRWKRRDCWT